MKKSLGRLRGWSLGVAVIFIVTPLAVWIAAVSGDPFRFLDQYEPQRVSARPFVSSRSEGYALLFPSRETPNVLLALRRELTANRGYKEHPGFHHEVIFEHPQLATVLYSPDYGRIYRLA